MARGAMAPCHHLRCTGNRWQGMPATGTGTRPARPPKHELIPHLFATRGARGLAAARRVPAVASVLPPGTRPSGSPGAAELRGREPCFSVAFTHHPFSHPIRVGVHAAQGRRRGSRGTAILSCSPGAHCPEPDAPVSRRRAWPSGAPTGNPSRFHYGTRRAGSPSPGKFWSGQPPWSHDRLLGELRNPGFSTRLTRRLREISKIPPSSPPSCPKSRLLRGTGHRA